MQVRLWLLIAGLGGAASVIAGAAAAHLADDTATATLLRNGSLYGMIHAAALVGLIGAAEGRESGRGMTTLAGWCFALGIVLFSFGQFAHAASGWRQFALLVPFGGTAFILGWVAIAILAFRRR